MIYGFIEILAPKDRAVFKSILFDRIDIHGHM